MSYGGGVYWLRKALLAAIITHPWVKEAEVYNPLSGELVNIARLRLYGGMELEEPGLTLSVHPYHTSYDIKKGVISSRTPCVEYKEYDTQDRRGMTTLGGAAHECCIKLMVQLYYQEARTEVQNLKGKLYSEKYPNKKHGYRFQYLEGDTKHTIDVPSTAILEDFSIDVYESPGEEVITQWLDILKQVIWDIGPLYPHVTYRQPVVLQTDFPTTSWTNGSSLVFHTGFHVVEFNAAEEVRPHKEGPPVNYINTRFNS